MDAVAIKSFCRKRSTFPQLFFGSGRNTFAGAEASDGFLIRINYNKPFFAIHCHHCIVFNNRGNIPKPKDCRNLF